MCLSRVAVAVCSPASSSTLTAQSVTFQCPSILHLGILFSLHFNRVSKIIIHFHSAQNNRQARDIQLLKNLRKLLKDPKIADKEDAVELASKEIAGIMKGFSSSEATLQAFDLLLASKYIKSQYILIAIDSALEEQTGKNAQISSWEIDPIL